MSSHDDDGVNCLKATKNLVIKSLHNFYLDWSHITLTLQQQSDRLNNSSMTLCTTTTEKDEKIDEKISQSIEIQLDNEKC